MAICVEVHYVSAGINLKVDGVGYTDPTYGIGTYALLPSKTQTEADCTGYLLQTVAEVRAHAESLSSLTLDVIGIDPAQIFYVFTWGMGAILLPWSLGFAVGAAVSAIKKL
jgi:hypothetical protein